MTALLLTLALAAASDLPAKGAPPAIDLQSGTLVVDHRARSAIFGGGVTAVRGGLTLRCDQIHAAYDGENRVTIVTCPGPVEASEQGRTMTAGSGRFDNLTGELTLLGAPTLVEGSRRVTGETLRYVVATQTAELTKADALLPARDVRAQGPLAGRGPLAVKAEHVTWDAPGRRAHFVGRVIATRGDLTLSARELTTTHDERGEVERAVTGGGPVTVVQGERRARAGRASFEGGKATLVLEGEPVVEERGSVLTGRRVTFLLAEDRVEVLEPKATFPIRAAKELQP